MTAKFSTNFLMALACLSAVLYANRAVLGQASEDNGNRYLQHSWTTENGLPQNSVTAIAQTRDGYLWLGTFGGLARFDGLKFTIFDTGSAPGLRSNRIVSLFEDRRRNLWIGTEHGGLTRYAGGKFTTFTTADGLPDDWIRSMTDDRDGALWVCTPKGVARYSEGRFFSLQTPGLAPERVAAFLGGRDGRFWVAMEGKLYRFENGQITGFDAPAGTPFGEGLFLFGARDGGVWVASTRGLYRFHDGVFTTLAVYPIQARMPDNVALRIYEDREGRLCLLTPRGVAQYRDGQVTPVRSINGIERVIAGNYDTRGVLEDREGNLWIGGIGKGLHRFRPGQVTAYTAEQGLADSSFVPIAAARDGGLWLGGENGSIFRYRAGEFSRLNYSIDPAFRAGLRALYEDRAGALWAGGYSGLLRLRDGQAVGWNQANSPLRGYPVAAIYEDRAGALWIGAGSEGNEGGLYRFRNDTFIPYRKAEGLVFNDVRCIVEDRDGSLWVGGVGGMSRFRDGRFTNYTTDNGLSHNYVRAIHQTPDGALWIGTYGGGLNRLKDGKFTHITTAHGLFDNVVSRILEDDRGNFWMSCNRGVYRASWRELNDFADGKIASVNCVAYNAGDGMASSETNGGGQPAGWKDADGRLWFPTQKGVVAVDPNRINPLPPLVAIEQLLVDAAPLDLYAPASSLSAPPGDGDLEIHYTAMSFTAPEKTRFKYQLEGYDKTWVDAGARRIAYYTKIAPGRYRFRVIAANSDGVWNETGAAIEFHLRPHFYQTGWFYALCVVAAALLGFAAYRLRVRQLVLRTQELETKVAERTSVIVEQSQKLEQANDQLAHANIRLNQSNDDLLSTFNQLRLGVVITDRNERVTFLSEAAERLLGQTGEEAVGRDWSEALPLQQQDLDHLRSLIALPPEQRSKLPAHVQGAGGRNYRMEIEAQDDPRDPARKIFCLYDVSEIYDLRSLLADKARFHDLIGESLGMQIVYKQIQDVARRAKPFIALNAGGLSESLASSQLFGHKRGAFTGAIADQVGVFEAANGGTLFLDEIGDIRRACRPVCFESCRSARSPGWANRSRAKSTCA